MAQLKAEVECELINSILVGEGSPLYRELYDSGLVSAGAISSEVLDGRGYFSVLFEGESRDPDQVRQKLWTQLQVLNQQGIGAEDFECAKKMLYGQAVWQFSSVEALASNLLSAGFDRLSVYDRIEAIATTSLQDLQNRLLQYPEEHCVLSVVSSVQK